MAATYPSRDPERSEGTTRPRLASAPEPANVARRSIWRWVLLGAVVVAAALVVGYFVLYGGGGSSGGGSGGGGGGGYFVLALPVERTVRLIRRLRNRS